MSLRPRERAQLLQENGFRLKRMGARHDIWTDGVSQLITSRGAKTKDANVQVFFVQLERALKKRAAERLLEGSNLTSPTTIRIQPGPGARLANRPQEKPMPAPQKLDQVPSPTHPTPAPAQVTHSVRRGIGDDRAVLIREIGELARMKQFNAGQIASIMNRRGWANDLGTPIGSSSVTHYCRANGYPAPLSTNKRGSSAVDPRDIPKRAPVAAVVAPAVVAAPVQEPVTVKAQTGARVRLSPQALSILTDPDMTDSEKVRMLCIYAGV